MLQTRRISSIVMMTLLAAPSVAMTYGATSGAAAVADLLHPTGETSARLMIIAMMIGPALAVFGRRRWLLWLLARRRWLGVAAFAYAVLHLIFYVIDMQTMKDMLAELDAPGIWTGWLAFFLFMPLAATSNDAAMRLLKAGWKRVQRIAYPAAVLTLAHWSLVHNNLGPALVHFAPLIALHLARIAITTRQRTMKGYQT